MPLSPQQGNALRLRETRNGSAQFSFYLIADSRNAGRLMLSGIFVVRDAPERRRLGCDQASRMLGWYSTGGTPVLRPGWKPDFRLQSAVRNLQSAFSAGA